MSIFQTLIASAVGGEPPPPQYPPVSWGYPITNIQAQTNSQLASFVAYYNLTDVTTGLWRKTYDGTALDGSYNIDGNFPTYYSAVQSESDPTVGFSSWSDVATNFTMQWIGYFRPAVDGDFYFYMNTDDYSSMWIGETAVSGFNSSNSIINCNNSEGYSNYVSLVANRYYPVRILYTEIQGGANCTVASGLNGQQLNTNQFNAASGMFVRETSDGNAAAGFPQSGLITS